MGTVLPNYTMRVGEGLHLCTMVACHYRCNWLPFRPIGMIANP